MCRGVERQLLWCRPLRFAPGVANAHTSAPFVSFGHGKRKIAIFTKSECLRGVRCRSRVRHSNRWARNQISCQSEILMGAKGEVVTYCHWESLAWRIRRSKPLEVWSEPTPVCQPMHGAPDGPSRRSAQRSQHQTQNLRRAVSSPSGPFRADQRSAAVPLREDAGFRA